MKQKKNKAYIIGIAGGSGSGKSTLARQLKAMFPKKITLLSCDDYYLPHDDLPLKERQNLNYDCPQAYDFSLLTNQLAQLKLGESVEIPQYNFINHSRKQMTKKVDTAPVIIVDGILIYCIEELRNMFDLKIYVEMDDDIRILRRMHRDFIERGRDYSNVVHQYITTVKPMHEKYVVPTRKYADLIIWGSKNEKVLDLLKTKIKSVLDTY